MSPDAADVVWLGRSLPLCERVAGGSHGNSVTTPKVCIPRRESEILALSLEYETPSARRSHCAACVHTWQGEHSRILGVG